MPAVQAQMAKVEKRVRYKDLLDKAWQQHMAPRSSDAPTVISTFAGCGGSSLGYSMVGFRELLAVEWDDNAVQTFKLNFSEVPVYHGDIAKLSVEEVLQRTRLKPGELDVFDGSPPCQGFSTSGRRNIDDPRSKLFTEYVRLLQGLQPKVFVMENVKGLVMGKMKLIFIEIMRALRQCGYLVNATLFNAKYFDVPQSRNRLIFIGCRKDLGIDPVIKLIPRIPRTARLATESVINDPAEIEMLLAAAKKYKTYERWEIMDLGGKWSDYSTDGKATGFSGYKIHPDKPCQTITKFAGNIAIHGPMHWQEKRRPSLAEFKRFASFPDQFQFTDWANGVARIGNSVPPLFMRAIANHIRETILEKACISN